MLEKVLRQDIVCHLHVFRILTRMAHCVSLKETFGNVTIQLGYFLQALILNWNSLNVLKFPAYFGKICDISICENSACLFVGSYLPFLCGYIYLCLFGKHDIFVKTVTGFNSFNSIQCASKVGPPLFIFEPPGI